MLETRKDQFRLRFLGAAGTVTGSKYLLSNDRQKILVDCGLFQGLKELRLKNWDRFPIELKEIDALILTHAHLDHSGYIPKLIKVRRKQAPSIIPKRMSMEELLIKSVLIRILQLGRHFHNRLPLEDCPYILL